MIITVTLKDPDVFYESIADFIKFEVEPELLKVGLNKDEVELISSARIQKYSELLAKWVSDGEYIQIEFDLDKMEAKVLESKVFY